MTSIAVTAQDAASTASTSGQPATPAPTTTEKPKKVWTNDDVAEANSNPAKMVAKPNSAKLNNAKPAKTVEGDPRLAQALRTKLQKLEPQLKDTEAQLSELKKFAAGETDGSNARDFHKGINRTTVPEQIAKLEAKQSQLQTQIQAIYDEARTKGILPGQLRY